MINRFITIIVSLVFAIFFLISNSCFANENEFDKSKYDISRQLQDKLIKLVEKKFNNWENRLIKNNNDRYIKTLYKLDKKISKLLQTKQLKSEINFILNYLQYLIKNKLVISNNSSNINSFVYQLQDTDFDQLLSLDYDLAVIDWEDANLSKSQLKQLQWQWKKILTYLSIGEAEDYREYWKKSWNSNPPDFLEKENPDWEGNYKVKYRNINWQNIMFDKLKSIVDAWYDWTYLDIIDGYYYFEEKWRDSAKQEMIDFVKKISNISKNINPKFLIIPQNSAELVEDQSYLQSIDGLWKEDTWYTDDDIKDTQDIEWEIKYLKQAKSEGKFVLVIDYATQKDKQCSFINSAKQYGFASFVSNRELNKIDIINCY